jgi:hypothetical protein
LASASSSYGLHGIGIIRLSSSDYQHQAIGIGIRISVIIITIDKVAQLSESK